MIFYPNNDMEFAVLSSSKGATPLVASAILERYIPVIPQYNYSFDRMSTSTDNTDGTGASASGVIVAGDIFNTDSLSNQYREHITNVCRKTDLHADKWPMFDYEIMFDDTILSKHNFVSLMSTSYVYTMVKFWHSGEDRDAMYPAYVCTYASGKDHRVYTAFCSALYEENSILDGMVVEYRRGDVFRYYTPGPRADLKWEVKDVVFRQEDRDIVISKFQDEESGHKYIIDQVSSSSLDLVNTSLTALQPTMQQLIWSGAYKI